MKYIFKFIVPLFLVASCSSDDSTDNDSNEFCVGDIILTSQTEINEFGEFGCNYVDGNFSIYGESLTDPITDLSPLSNLKEVTKNFSISSVLGNVSIVDGFQNLEKVGLDFVYGGGYDGDVKNLIEISGFNALQSVGQDFMITQTGPLKIITGFNSLEIIDGDFDFWWNDSLEELAGFQNLKQVEGSFKIYQNEGSFKINSFSNLESVGEEFFIDLNTGISSISGFNKLNFVGRIFEISRNDSLINVSGFLNIENLWNIHIHNNEVLEEIGGFNNLTSTTYEFVLERNFNLHTVTAFQNVNNVEYVSINSTSLENVSFLDNLKFINDGGVGIYRNDNLLNVDGLSSLESISGNLLLNMNSQLTDFCGLENILQNGFSGDLIINDNAYNPTNQDFQQGNCSL